MRKLNLTLSLNKSEFDKHEVKFSGNVIGLGQGKINPDKIKVVHWGIDEDFGNSKYKSPLCQRDKIVLFLGRVTLQKGPDYFVETAKKVAEYGYASMLKGKTVAIHGLMNYLMANSVRFAPRALVVKLTRKIQDKAK